MGWLDYMNNIPKNIPKGIPLLDVQLLLEFQVQFQAQVYNERKFRKGTLENKEKRKEFNLENAPEKNTSPRKKQMTKK